MNQKSQTSTEYLVIISIVIIIAIIVISTLQNVPSLGSGASAGSETAAIASGDIGITSFKVSIAKTEITLRNNKQTDISITNISINQKLCWVPGSIPGIDGLPRNMKMGESVTFACNTVASSLPSEKFEWVVSINYTLLDTQAQYTYSPGKIKGTATAWNCPANFIPVGGITLMDKTVVSDFCVMKYEAKAWNTTSNSVDDNGCRTQTASCGTVEWQPPLLTSITPVSIPSGLPFRYINQTDAINECQSLGTGYDLISDKQWMAIAETVLRLPINNLNSSESEIRMAVGHSDGKPTANMISATSANDPITTGCDIWKSLDNDANAFNSTCQLRGNGSSMPFGYNGTNDTFTERYLLPPLANTPAGRSQLRTHVLANGHVVWDMSGNAEDMTKTAVTNWSSTVFICDYYNLVNLNSNNWGCDAVTTFESAFTPFPWTQTSRQLTNQSGAGKVLLFADSSTNYFFARGASHGPAYESGIFTVYTWSKTDIPTLGSVLGFRCVYS